MPARDPSVLGRLRLGSPAVSDPDATLLERFARERDEAAFAALVCRHGPMVMGVCRRTVGDAHAAEDAFQATFLVLARKAASLARPETLAGWLHGVARRVALKARAALPGRGEPSARDRTSPTDHGRDPLAELSGRELLAVLEDEVQRLPAAYRLPVALCCLEGLTQEEAARRLGLTPGAVRGRLGRGRARLHARLAGRGLIPAAVLAVAGYARVANAAGVPAGLATLTIRAAGRYVTGAGAGGGAVPANPRRLAEGVLNAMLVTRLKLTAALTSVLLVLAGSAALGRHGPTDGDPPAPTRGVDDRSPVVQSKEGTKPGNEPPAVERKIHGRWVGRGLVPVVFTFRADGTFERSVLDERSEGTWAISWDALPPTLTMKYTQSDNPDLANATYKLKVVQLDDAVFAVENPDGLRPIGYTRLKP